MKLWAKLTAILMLVSIIVLLGGAVYRTATRPTGLDWTTEQIRDSITKGTSRERVLSLLGSPHSIYDNDEWNYINSYHDRTIRRRIGTPRYFGIFFEEDKVSLVLMAHD